ncbi:MAG: hypothetical protein ACRC67_09510 [Inquilinus sp.]
MSGRTVTVKASNFAKWVAIPGNAALAINEDFIPPATADVGLDP